MKQPGHRLKWNKSLNEPEVDQGIVKHDVRALQDFRGAQREQVRRAGSGAHQRHEPAHDGSLRGPARPAVVTETYPK